MNIKRICHFSWVGMELLCIFYCRNFQFFTTEYFYVSYNYIRNAKSLMIKWCHQSRKYMEYLTWALKKWNAMRIENFFPTQCISIRHVIDSNNQASPTLHDDHDLGERNGRLLIVMKIVMGVKLSPTGPWVYLPKCLLHYLFFMKKRATKQRIRYSHFHYLIVHHFLNTEISSPWNNMSRSITW